MRASLPRASTLLTLVLLATVLLWPSPGSAEDLPPALVGSALNPVGFYQDTYVRGGGGTPGAKIEAEVTSTGAPLACKERDSLSGVLIDGPTYVDGSGSFRCSIPGKDFHNPGKTETTTSITVFQVVNDVRSVGLPVPVTFAASTFSLDIDINDPPKLATDEPILFTGTRVDGQGFNLVRIDWTLKRNGVSVFPERDTDKRSCDAGEQGGDVETFTCYFDSDKPDVRTPPDVDDDLAPSTVTPAVAARPVGLVLPAVLPDGVYSTTLNEVVGDDVVDTISFSFTVGTGEPPPNAPPGGGGGGGGDDSTEVSGQNAETIPLAPIPTPGPVIDDSPLPESPEASDSPSAAPSVTTVDDDVLRILILAVIAFTVMAMSGARGLGAPRRLVEAPVDRSVARHLADDPTTTRDAGIAVLGGLGAGELEGADDDAGRARPFGNAWGDRSVTWRFPGWSLGDTLSRRVPVSLAPRLPLVARVAADGSYWRAALGVLWTVLPTAGLALGAVAALSDGAAPLPPALGLVAALLVLAVLDASAGVAAVTAFTAITLARGGLTAEGLSLAEGVRGLMGLAALWFVAPLVAAAARPLRRVAEPEHVYPWDRFGDTVIAALISGWAVQGIVGSLGDLTGRDLAVTSHADALALLTIGAVVGRFLLEEAAGVLYPRRLRAVQEADELPPPTRLQQIRALVFRAALLAFFAGAFLGSCWQLWLGVAIFSIPQVLQLLEDRLPDVRSLASAVPRGVVQILVLVAVGAAIAYAVDSRGSDDELSAIRQGFVFLAIPGAALEIFSVVGGETPKPRWTWPRQLAGAAVVAVTAGLVLFLL